MKKLRAIVLMWWVIVGFNPACASELALVVSEEALSHTNMSYWRLTDVIKYFNMRDASFYAPFLENEWVKKLSDNSQKILHGEEPSPLEPLAVLNFTAMAVIDHYPSLDFPTCVYEYMANCVLTYVSIGERSVTSPTMKYLFSEDYLAELIMRQSDYSKQCVQCLRSFMPRVVVKHKTPGDSGCITYTERRSCGCMYCPDCWVEISAAGLPTPCFSCAKEISG